MGWKALHCTPAGGDSPILVHGHGIHMSHAILVKHPDGLDQQTHTAFCPWLCGMVHCRRVHNPPWNYTHRADSALPRNSPGPARRAWRQSGLLTQCPTRNDERQLGVLSPIRDGRTKISFSPSNGDSNQETVGLVFLSQVNDRPEMAFALPHLKT